MNEHCRKKGNKERRKGQRGLLQIIIIRPTLKLLLKLQAGGKEGKGMDPTQKGHTA